MESSRQRVLRVVAVIPAFNEEEAIATVICGTRHHVHEVIVVDDGSTDRTAAIASGAGATVISHLQNRGKSSVIMTAFQAATEREADILVLIDGDGQHRADDIPRLIQPIIDGTADVVVGSRFLDLRSPTPAYRKLGQHLLNALTQHGSSQPCSDSQSGFRAFNRQAFSSIRLTSTSHHGMAAESEMQFRIIERGLQLREVPIQVTYHSRTRRNPIRHGIGVISCIALLTLQRHKPAAVGLPARATAVGVAVIALLSWAVTWNS